MAATCSLPYCLAAFVGKTSVFALDMEHFTETGLATWSIAAVAAGGVVIRPWGLPEAVWAVLGAVALALFGLLPAPAILSAILEGTDVYLFLAGMMLLAELARLHGLFDWVAAHAAKAAKGSAPALFNLIYGVGIVVTAFLSNDATAVVLTPAVYAAAKAAKAESPTLPLHLRLHRQRRELRAADIQSGQPRRLWRSPSIAATLAEAIHASLDRWRLPRHTRPCDGYSAGNLTAPIAADPAAPSLTHGGRYTAYGLGLAAAAMLASSALDVPLGAPTFAAGVATSLAVLFRKGIAAGSCSRA